MAALMLKTLLITYALYALLKLTFFFLVDYRRRKIMLDRAYRRKASLPRKSDEFLLAFLAVLIVLQWWVGIEQLSFLTGLLTGMTLIQLYFHRFSVPLSDKQAPKQPVSPIKLMSYGIQAAPGRAWKELIGIAVLLLWSVVVLAIGASG